MPRRNRPKGCWSGRSTRTKLAILAAISIIASLAISLGLGFGLQNYRNKKDNESPRTYNPNSPGTPPAEPIPSPEPWKAIWKPTPNITWQIVLQQAIDLPATATNTVPPEAEVWDIDLFLNAKETIATLHKLGKKVVCYFSAGSYEPNRPDSWEFRENEQGHTLDGWPDERWLDLKNGHVRGIMQKRIQLAKYKGCDGIDPDNLDAYDNDNGLGLTSDDSVWFLHWLTREAVANDLAIGLKNAAKIIPWVLPGMQFSVNEQCVQMEECEEYSKFIQDGKPVFHIEYPNKVKGNQRIASSLCLDTGPAKGATNFSTVIKNENLDGWVQYCDGKSSNTATASDGKPKNR